MTIVWIKYSLSTSIAVTPCSLGSSNGTADGNGASEAAANADKNEDSKVVPVHEVSGFPLVWEISDLSSGWVELKVLLVVVSRADVSDLSVSEDEASDEPGETSATNWASEDSGKSLEDVVLGSGMEELDDGQNNSAHVDDEAPLEPGLELLGDIFVSELLGGRWSGGGCGSPALSLIWIVLPVGPEEVSKDSVDDEVASSLSASVLWGGFDFIFKVHAYNV